MRWVLCSECTGFCARDALGSVGTVRVAPWWTSCSLPRACSMPGCTPPKAKLDGSAARSLAASSREMPREGTYCEPPPWPSARSRPEALRGGGGGGGGTAALLLLLPLPPVARLAAAAASAFSCSRRRTHCAECSRRVPTSSRSRDETSFVPSLTRVTHPYIDAPAAPPPPPSSSSPSADAAPSPPAPASAPALGGGVA